MSHKIARNASSEKMYPSMIITYKGSSLLGFKRDCLSSINQVRVFEYIAVEQRIVNYKMWRQQHQLEQIENGVLIDDTIIYPIPIGFLGAVMNSLLIKKQLKQIFDYRTIASENQFDKFYS